MKKILAGLAAAGMLTGGLFSMTATADNACTSEHDHAVNTYRDVVGGDAPTVYADGSQDDPAAGGEIGICGGGSDVVEAGYLEAGGDPAGFYVEGAYGDMEGRIGSDGDVTLPTP